MVRQRSERSRPLVDLALRFLAGLAILLLNEAGEFLLAAFDAIDLVVSQIAPFLLYPVSYTHLTLPTKA